MRLKLMALFGLLVLCLSNLPMVKAAPSANATINLTIGSVSQLTLNDTAVDLGTVNPGANSTIFGMLLTNTGSSDITNIFPSVDSLIAGTNPRGTGTSANWAATNFLALANGTSGNDYLYVGKILWNATEVNWGDWSYTAGADAIGDYWEGGSSTADLYYWQITNGTNGQCNQSDARLNITAAKGGFNPSAGASTIPGSEDADWATCTIGSGPWINYCIYAYYDCTKLYLTAWDYNSTFPTGCTTKKYLRSSTLSPGNSVTFRIKGIVQPSVPDGATTQSVLRLYGS